MKRFILFFFGWIFLISSWAQDYQVGDELQMPTPKPGYRMLEWDDLTRPDWDAMAVFNQYDFSQFDDNDPRAEELLKKMREAMNHAPVVEKLNGEKISIAGFVVPLEEMNGQLQEFLLVPFFGACIHVPPPPGNQIIHVVADKPLPTNNSLMLTVIVNGVLETVYTDTPMGGAGYRINRADVSIY